MLRPCSCPCLLLSMSVVAELPGLAGIGTPDLQYTGGCKLSSMNVHGSTSWRPFVLSTLMASFLHFSDRCARLSASASVLSSPGICVKVNFTSNRAWHIHIARAASVSRGSLPLPVSNTLTDAELSHSTSICLPF